MFRYYCPGEMATTEDRHVQTVTCDVIGGVAEWFPISLANCTGNFNPL